MRAALDTNRYVDLMRGDAVLASSLATAEEVVIPFVVVAELRAGFSVGSRGAENERVLATFRDRPGVVVRWPDDETTRHWGRLWAQLRNQGTPVPTNDLWIAALCVQHDLVLHTRDRHFDRLPQVLRG